VLVECWRRDFWTRATVRRFGWTAAGFAIVWFVVDDLKMHLIGNGLIGQTASLRNQVCTSLPELIPRVRAMATEAVPILFGARSMPVAAARMRTSIVAGSWAIGVVVAATLVVIGVGSRFQGFRSADAANDGRPRERGFGAYLALVGLFTAFAYPLSCNVTPHMPPLLRYLLLALLMPIGLFVAFAERARSHALRTCAAAGFVVWASLNLWDNVRVIRDAVHDPPLGEHRAIVNYLLQQRIRYARAIYWDAYVIDFLSAERVITASVDIVRIPDYQKQVDEHAAAAVTLERQPCEGTTKVGAWCVVR
jgi:hypothetical protein